MLFSSTRKSIIVGVLTAWSAVILYGYVYVLSRKKADHSLIAPLEIRPAVLPEYVARKSKNGVKSQEHKFNWDAVESTNYVVYIRNLRAVGFPEKLIQGIIQADLDKLYEVTEKALVSADAQNTSKKLRDHLKEILQLRAVRIKKQEAMEELFSTYFPRELLRTPTARNYEAFRVAINLLPETKRNGVQTLFEDFWIEEDSEKEGTANPDKELQLYILANNRLRNELKSLLTEEELKKFDLQTEITAITARERTLAMSPTDVEFEEIFRATREFEIDTGRVFGRSRANKVSPTLMLKAEQKRDEKLQAALGNDRYHEYLLATTQLGNNLIAFRNRFNLPSEFAHEAFEAIEDATRAVQKSGGPKAEEMLAMQERLRALFPSEDLYNAWQSVSLEPISLEP
jgi:hypothetical protein